MKIEYGIQPNLIDKEYPYMPYFKIDNQRFYLDSVKTEGAANWYLDQLRTAFLTLRNNTKCECTPDENTGSIQIPCCNICGLQVQYSF